MAPPEEKKSVTVVTPETPGTQLSKDDISTEIDFKLAKQLLKIGAGVVSGVGILVLGTIIGAMWTMNGEINALNGKYSSPDKFMEMVTTKVQRLEDENKLLNDKIYNLEIQKLQDEINRLKTTKK